MNLTRPVGEQLRDWRQRRRLTQMDLAAIAETSTRHVSFIETGRSLPSRAMLMRLVERLEVPLRERNQLLTAAGLAPMYRESRLDAPALAQARAAVDLVLRGHEPYPALAVDRHWNIVATNRAIAPFLAGAAAHLLEPPINMMRLSLHPDGLATRIVNFGQIRAHLLHNAQRQTEATGDPQVRALYEELLAYPVPPDTNGDPPSLADSVAMQLQLHSDYGVLSFISTITVFGTPLDVTLSELAIESFFPADARTAEVLRELMNAGG
ncbi:MAG TPA: helix-turn-helix transcriptional regulator [Tahibacter sp.]|uniref:helix-turn-helix domain-containing protein n=1 Tax=Tahibacter sp. TaxID=2056211 RepID=UPI002BD15AA9|nr:helix-turn-helix transcriptional regulator [Tahibacter sp.]HSX61857.1 helix-turn-helix transcriptional regulator [Tahibacter sp.]